MGSSFSSWEGVTACFMFADSPLALVAFAAGVLAICTALIVSIKRHEDEAFEAHLDHH